MAVKARHLRYHSKDPLSASRRAQATASAVDRGFFTSAGQLALPSWNAVPGLAGVSCWSPSSSHRSVGLSPVGVPASDGAVGWVLVAWPARVRLIPASLAIRRASDSCPEYSVGCADR